MKKLIIALSLILVGCNNNVATIDDINISLPTNEIISVDLLEEIEPVEEVIEEMVIEVIPDNVAIENLTKDDILWLQESLKIAGYYTTRDGDFGPGTETSLEAFQLEAGLESLVYDTDTKELLRQIRLEKLAPNFGTNLVLLNKNYYLPNAFVPDNLREVIIDKSKYIELPEHVAVSVEQMFMDAKADGIDIVLASGYRSYDYQEGIFSKRVAKNGFAEAETVVAIPGESEHQTGLAIDITTSEMNFGLSQTFENDPAFDWMMDNCYKYGFILRYLKGRESETGYIYEPWHYRYIGNTEAAKLIMDQGLILEEYFE
jgi:LAS superfamily LD-carboxypeptidase LdcB